MLLIISWGVIESQIASQRFRSNLRLTELFSGFILKSFIYTDMQDQDFTNDRNLENDQNQETDNASPEAETVQNINLNKEEQEQETLVFSRPVEVPIETPNVSSDDNISSNASPDEEELFGKYEIKPWNWTPRIYKIFAFSAIFNILFLITVAQTNILRAKACDSPLVGSFCQVIDTLYVGGKMLNTDSGFVDKEYERTELENSEVVWLDQTGIDPPLNYPAGYFQIANPENYLLPEQIGTTPGINDFPAGISTNPTTVNPTVPSTVSPNNSGVFNRAARVPKVPKTPLIKGKMPAEIVIPDEETKPNDTKTPNTDTTAENKDKKNETINSKPESKPITEIELNRQPLIDLGKYVSEKLNKNEVNLGTTFVVQAKGKLNKDGKIDQNSFKIIQKESSDEDMIDIILRSIAAMNDSGYLQYIKEMSGKDLNLLLKQDDQFVSAVVETEMESEMRAKSIKSNLDLAISLVKMKKNGENQDENDRDDLALLEGAKVERDGKKIIIKFDVKKDIAQPMLERKLKISRETPQIKPNNPV